jgi:hypothetical protein
LREPNPASFSIIMNGSQADSLLVVMFQVCWSHQISAFWCSSVLSRSTDRAPRTLPGCPVAKASPPRQLGPWCWTRIYSIAFFGPLMGPCLEPDVNLCPDLLKLAWRWWSWQVHFIPFFPESC